MASVVSQSEAAAATPSKRGDQLAVAPEAVVLLVDKPSGWTSFDVVKKLRRLLGVRKIGHAGTLDPMATGLLICCVGKATKQVEHFMGLEKGYAGCFRLGEETPSHDADTPVSRRSPWEHVTGAEIEAAMAALVGEIQQEPPMYSAVKVEGQRLYRLARQGRTVARKARTVTVSSFEFVDRAGPDVRFRVRCSKGTYVRSLAHDVGASLGCGAHLIELRRERIGPYSVEDAWTLTDLEKLLTPGS